MSQERSHPDEPGGVDGVQGDHGDPEDGFDDSSEELDEPSEEFDDSAPAVDGRAEKRRVGPPTDGELAASVDPDPGETVTLVERRTRRWYGVGCLALLALGAGLITETAAPLLAGVFGIAFAGYGVLTTPPSPDLSVERTLDPATTEPGESVAVTVTVANEGRWPLLDLRIVDGVPERLGVTEGTPRDGAVLVPGAAATFTYTVRAARGEHDFDRVTVVARDAAGATERVLAVGEPSTLTVAPTLPTEPPVIPLRKEVSQFTGRFPGDTGGPGLEFHATRQYRRGDPLSRVDWRRTARTGELTTVEYRVERTVRVCLVVDARRSAHVGPEPASPSAVERGVEGAIAAYAGLTADGHDVGVGAFAPTDCWLEPGSGDRHRRAAKALFASDPALSGIAPDAETNLYERTQRLQGRLPADAQVVLFSPLTDDRILATAVRLDARGYAITVISPDPTADGTTGQVFARVRRRLRIADLRSRAIPVVDWGPDEDLDRAIARMTARWSG